MIRMFAARILCVLRRPGAGCPGAAADPTADAQGPAGASGSACRPIPSSREKINAWTVGPRCRPDRGRARCVSGGGDGPESSIDGDNLHVLPIVTRGPTEKSEFAALSAAGVDLGDHQLRLAGRIQDPVPGTAGATFNYLLNLFPSELHGLRSGPEIQKPAGTLAGKKGELQHLGDCRCLLRPR